LRKSVSFSFLLLLGLTMLVPTASAFGLERPGGYVRINQRTENAKTDGHASVGIGVGFEDYTENRAGFPAYGNDYVQL